MKLFPRRLLAAALSLVLLLTLAACGGEGAPSSKTAMGRYVESEVTLPAEFAMVSGLRENDGVLELLAYPKPAEGTGSIYLASYRSSDGGATWTEEKPAWLDFFNGEDFIGVNFAAWGADQTLWFYIDHEVDGATKSSFARLDGDTVTVLDWEAPYASSGSGPRGFRLAENGDLVVDCISEFLQVDSATGKVKNIYTAALSDGGTWNDGWALSGNTLTLSEASRIVRYDLSTGKEVSSLPCQGPSITDYDSGLYYRLMDFGPDGNLYFADTKGIFRAVEGNDTLEHLADGSLLSLSIPSVRVQQLLALKDQFLVLAYSNKDWKLFSYTYDPDVPTLPDAELAVWSLYDDPLISQAIGELLKRDPGVHVTYTVGMPENGSVTRDDAIRALATQITAGKSPDVLVLDGLPYDSYVEKGVLADISERLTALNDTDALLSNIVGAYRQSDGKTFAVPAQFQVPMLHGSSDAMESIHDLTSMADWLESTKGDFRTPFLFTKAKNILRALYPSCAAGLVGSDGNMDAEKLKDFLAQMKRITDLRTEVDESDDHNDWGDSIDFDFGPLGWMAGNNALDLGNLSKFQGLYSAWTASDKKGDGSIDTLFGANAFLPITSLGISAQSKQQDLAWKFIEAALSDEVQSQAVGKGIPVSAAAYDTATLEKDSYNEGQYSTYGTSFQDAEGAIVPVHMAVMYPPQEYRQQMSDRLKTLDTPLFYDAMILQFITDGSADYIGGKSDLDTAVTNIMQKLKLYEAE